MYKLTSAAEQSLRSTTCPARSQEEVAFAFATPGGKRPKEKQCFSVSLRPPHAGSLEHLKQPRGLWSAHSLLGATVAPQSIFPSRSCKGQRGHAPFHHWGVGLVEEARDEKRPLCLATPRGVPSCPPMGLWSSGSGRTSHSVPGPRGQLRVVPGTSVFRIRLDTQDGMQFLGGEPQQVLQVTDEAVHVAFA